MKLRILIAYSDLRERTAADSFICDLCRHLKGAGHDLAVLAFSPGSTCAELSAAGVDVVSTIDAVPFTPEVIHTDRRFETLATSLRFPSIPVVWLFEGSTPWAEPPPKLPSVRRYAVTDYFWRESAAHDLAVSEDRIQIVHHYVDLTRCAPRPPLPEAPEQAVAIEEKGRGNAHIPFIREACRRKGIDLTVLEEGKESTASSLARYDLVFAKGRIALEALVVGCAVVPCDESGTGEMIDTTNVLEMWHSGFGKRTFTSPMMPRSVEKLIENYRVADAEECSQFVRAHCGMEIGRVRLEALYREAIDEANAQPIDVRELCRAASLEVESLGATGEVVDPGSPVSKEGALNKVGRRFKNFFRG